MVSTFKSTLNYFYQVILAVDCVDRYDRRGECEKPVTAMYVFFHSFYYADMNISHICNNMITLQ